MPKRGISAASNILINLKKRKGTHGCGRKVPLGDLPESMKKDQSEETESSVAENGMVTVPAEYLTGLQRKVENLSTLIGISEIISSTHQLDELMNMVMDRAKQEMDAEGCSILFYNQETNKLEFEVAFCGNEATGEMLKKTITLEMGQGIAGWVAEKREPLVIEDVSADPRFFGAVDEKTGFITRSLIAVPLIGRTGLIGVAEIVNPRRKEFDQEIFQLLCRQFAIAIENALLYRESIRRERLKQELEIAAVLQTSFLPESPGFEKGDIRVTAMTIPASQIGGDLYDFVEPDEGRVGVLIGDVSGKGVSAALYMAKAVSDFRYAARLHSSPGEVLEVLNAQLSRAPRGMFLTAAYLIADVATGAVDVASAGHPPVLWISKGEVRALSVDSGPPLGILPATYPSTTVRMQRGDRLIMITDGVFDARDAAGRRIGFDRIVDYVRENRDLKDMTGRLIAHVKRSGRGVEQADDITIVELQWGA
jgi:sigma-B regulation protein RsbU (phosphoserine phosphatase)